LPDAFVDGEKGGKLVECPVDPPRVLNFTENEVRNIELFKEAFTKNGTVTSF